MRENGGRTLVVTGRNADHPWDVRRSGVMREVSSDDE